MSILHNVLNKLTSSNAFNLELDFEKNALPHHFTLIGLAMSGLFHRKYICKKTLLSWIYRRFFILM